MTDPVPSVRICRGCGCDDLHACPDGCSWVLLDIATPSGICSQCADEMNWEPAALAQAICEAAVIALGDAGYA